MFTGAAFQTRSIFEYDDYRQYLRDLFAAKKAKDKKFSFRFFARIAGFKAHSFARLVLQGKADLSDESIEKFSNALKLNKEESVFFKNLVKLNQSQTAHEKQKFAQEILSSKSYKRLHPLAQSQMVFYSHWYHTPIRELTCLPDFQENPEWIAKKLNHQITPGVAKKALELLIELGLLKRDPSGRLVEMNPHVTSTDEVSSAYLMQFHKEFLGKAIEAVETVPFKKREISSITVGIKKETAQKIKEMIKNFRKEVVAVCSQDDAVETIYQINFQLFPLIHTKDEGEI